MSPEGQYACFNLRQWANIDSKIDVFADAVRYTYETLGLTPVFILMNYKSDMAITEKVAERAGVPHIILPRIKRPDLALGILGRMKLTTAMRMHAVLLSASMGVSVVGIGYDPKVSAFLKYIGQELFVDLDALTEESLRHMIDQAVGQSRRPEDQAAAVRRLQELEQQNVAVARRLLRP